jgi:hypothetical protein
MKSTKIWQHLTACGKIRVNALRRLYVFSVPYNLYSLHLYNLINQTNLTLVKYVFIGPIKVSNKRICHHLLTLLNLAEY